MYIYIRSICIYQYIYIPINIYTYIYISSSGSYIHTKKITPRRGPIFFVWMISQIKLMYVWYSPPLHTYIQRNTYMYIHICIYIFDQCMYLHICMYIFDQWYDIDKIFSVTQVHLGPQAALVHQAQEVGPDTVVVWGRPVNRVSTVVHKTRCRAS